MKEKDYNSVSTSREGICPITCNDAKAKATWSTTNPLFTTPGIK